MTALFPYLLITLKVIESEKVSFSAMRSLKTVLNTLTVDDKYSLLNRDNLTTPIQKLVSQKQKNFSEYFSGLLKSTVNLKLFQKKDDPHSRLFSEISYSENRN